MARVVQRCQERQRRTWCWSRPVRPLAAWKDSSMRHPSWPAPTGAAAHQGWSRHDVRRWSSNSCGPSQRPSRPSAHRYGAAAHTGRNAARSDPSPPKTPTTTDPGLRYEPRRPRPIQMYSQTPNNAAVTALTSADTPKTHQSQSTAAVLASPAASCATRSATWPRSRARRWSSRIATRNCSSLAVSAPL